jgi:transcriptional regulator with GAF, ATPase, and Fis domain
MDENEFFREATLHICGNLVLEEAMFSTFRFLRKEMPVDRLFLQFQDVGLNSLRIIAMATAKKAVKVDLLTPLSPEALQEQSDLVNEYRQRNKPNFIWLFQDNPEKNPVIREVFELHKMKATSLMVIPLGATGKVLGGGSLVLTTEGDRKFTQQHADLLSLLKEPFSIAMSNALKHREVEKLQEILADDNRYLKGELKRITGDSIIGANFGLKEVMEKVSQVASLDSPVLLLGETGVGKDVIANAIHYSSTRRDGPFINVNCGAIPDTLIDSELFGHEKGAFTGAISQKRGRFERADKGTIFLDEIAELPLLSQVRLLHVLQNKTIERLGGTKTLKLDIRVIAATNQDLKERIKTNQFREDLWFRLNVFPIIIPPLRERKSDIPALLQHFLALKSKQLKLPAIPPLSPGAVETLMEYHWPGNVRELENIVERALILNKSGPLHFDHLKTDQEEGYSHLTGEPDDIENLDEAVIRHIQKILDRTGGKIHGPGGAADLLGINASTLRNRMKKLGIVYGRRGK